MPNNYQFVDAYSSVLTAESSIVSGSTHRPTISIGSILVAVPTTFSGSPSISGAVTVVGNPSISGTVNIGNSPSVYGNISGSVVSHQGTDPWRISSVYGNISGSVVSHQGTDPWRISSVYGNISGSVLSQQLGTRISSIVGSIPSSTLVGTYGHRNDNVASFVGGNLTWNPIATNSAGQPLIKPFAAEEARIEGYSSTVNTSQTTLVAAAGAGLRNYITDLWFANTGGAATLITLKDGAGSILGYTIAPSGSGSNLPGLQMPIRTSANASFDFQATTGTSVLYATVKGFKAP